LRDAEALKQIIYKYGPEVVSKVAACEGTCGIDRNSKQTNYLYCWELEFLVEKELHINFHSYSDRKFIIFLLSANETFER
jgi:hypothetical protein